MNRIAEYCLHHQAEQHQRANQEEEDMKQSSSSSSSSSSASSKLEQEHEHEISTAAAATSKKAKDEAPLPPPSIEQVVTQARRGVNLMNFGAGYGSESSKLSRGVGGEGGSVRDLCLEYVVRFLNTQHSSRADGNNNAAGQNISSSSRRPDGELVEEEDEPEVKTDGQLTSAEAHVSQLLCHEGFVLHNHNSHIEEDSCNAKKRNQQTKCSDSQEQRERERQREMPWCNSFLRTLRSMEVATCGKHSTFYF